MTARQLEDYLLSVPGHSRRASPRRSARSATPPRPSRCPIPVDLASGSSVTINGARGLLIGDFDRAGQRRDLATQWRRVRDRRNPDLEPGARHRPFDALMAAAAAPPPPSADGAAVRTLELTKHYGAAVALSGPHDGGAPRRGLRVPRTERQRQDHRGQAAPRDSAVPPAARRGCSAVRRGIARPGAGWGICPSSSATRAGSARAEVLGLHCRLAGIARAEWPAQISGALSTVGLSRPRRREGRDLLQRDAAASRPRRRAARAPGAGDPRRADVGARPGGPSRHPHDHPPPSGSGVRRLSQLASPRRGRADLRSGRGRLRRPRPGDRRARRAPRQRRGAHAAHRVDRRGTRRAHPPRRGSPSTTGGSSSTASTRMRCPSWSPTWLRVVPGSTPSSRCARRSRSGSSR